MSFEAAGIAAIVVGVDCLNGAESGQGGW